MLKFTLVTGGLFCLFGNIWFDENRSGPSGETAPDETLRAIFLPDGSTSATISA
jgi:hypothetical protein